VDRFVHSTFVSMQHLNAALGLQKVSDSSLLIIQHTVSSVLFVIA